MEFAFLGEYLPISTEASIVYTSSIEISRKAIRSNLKFLRGHLAEKVTLSCVVKGNAYGHDIATWVPLLYRYKVRHFSVFSAVEAKRCLDALASAKEPFTVMIMGEIADWDLAWAIKNEVEFYVFDFGRLQAAIETAKQLKQPARIHLEVETGMNRTGFEIKDLAKLVKTLHSHQRHLELKGLCTHFAGAESVSNYLRIQEQKKSYLQWKSQLAKEGIKPERYHCCCSAAMFALPEMHMDMVRIGILSYGFWPSQEIFVQFLKTRKHQREDPLKRAISWKSRLMTTKNVEVGEFIGYGTSYLAERPTRIGVVPVGYAYGFSRSLSNQGRVLIRGQRTAIVGIVNMNLLLVELTDIPSAQRGDEVVIIGKQRKNSITVASFGDLSNLLNYELLTRLPHSIPRVTVE